jgi:hypothetical protein
VAPRVFRARQAQAVTALGCRSFRTSIDRYFLADRSLLATCRKRVLEIGSTPAYSRSPINELRRQREPHVAQLGSHSKSLITGILDVEVTICQTNEGVIIEPQVDEVSRAKGVRPRAVSASGGCRAFPKTFKRTVLACLMAMLVAGDVVHIDASLIRAKVAVSSSGMSTRW